VKPYLRFVRKFYRIMRFTLAMRIGEDINFPGDPFGGLGNIPERLALRTTESEL